MRQEYSFMVDGSSLRSVGCDSEIPIDSLWIDESYMVDGID